MNWMGWLACLMAGLVVGVRIGLRLAARSTRRDGDLIERQTATIGRAVEEYREVSATLNAIMSYHVRHEGPHDECCTCGMFACPENDPLHFHHDGCPSCETRWKDGPAAALKEGGDAS